jgi:intracellular sulfur oxidation DsrE/DsrF family protein
MGLKNNFNLLIQVHQMNINYIKLNWFLALVSLAFLMSVSSTQAAITKSQPNNNQAVVYFVESADLKGLKQGMVDLNLYLREEGRLHLKSIKIVLHGSGVRFFKKPGMDPELEYMLKWFREEGIQVGVCEGCLEEHNVDKNSLFTGLQIWKVTTPERPVFKSQVY